MKRLILIFSIVLSAFVVAVAQMPSTFFGLKLDATTMSEALPVLEELGFQQNPLEYNAYVLTDVEYDGFKWDVVTVYFVETDETSDVAVLQAVQFSRDKYILLNIEDGEIEYIDEKDAKESMSEIDAFGGAVKKMLLNNYSQYLVEETDDYTTFIDKNIETRIETGSSLLRAGYMIYSAQLVYLSTTNN